jgi:hypothetical protein
MRKFNTTIILLIFSINFFAQTALKENEIIGKWKVVDAKITMKGGNSNENIIKTKEGFINSIFHIGGNGIFDIEFKENVPWFFKEFKKMSNNNWKYEKTNKSIKVGKEKDNFTIMEIFPFKNENKSFFRIVGFIFEVERISKEKKSSYIQIETKKEEKNKIENTTLERQDIKGSEIFDYKIVEEKPTSPKCKSKNEEKMEMCFKKEIQKHFMKKFNTTLPNNLGLMTGNLKITNTFIINKNGEIVNIQSSGKSPELNNECQRVISLLPKMNPGIHKGNIVNVKYELPFTTRVE